MYMNIQGSESVYMTLLPRPGQSDVFFCQNIDQNQSESLPASVTSTLWNAL